MSTRQATQDAVEPWLIMALAGLGISSPWNEVLGGVLLAIAGALLAWKLSPGWDTRSFWIVVAGAVFAAVLTFEVIDHAKSAGWIGQDVPAQFLAAMAGFGSRHLMRFMLKAFGVAERKADTVVDRVVDRVIPGGDQQMRRRGHGRGDDDDDSA